MSRNNAFLLYAIFLDITVYSVCCNLIHQSRILYLFSVTQFTHNLTGIKLNAFDLLETVECRIPVLSYE